MRMAQWILRIGNDGKFRGRHWLRACAVLLLALMPAVTPAQGPEPGTASDGRSAGEGGIGEQAPRIISGGSSRRHFDDPRPASQVPLVEEVPQSQQPGTIVDTDSGANNSTVGMPAGVPVVTSDGVVAGAPVGPLGDARRRWQEAVRAGRTDLGFRAWVLGALEEPAQATPDNGGEPAGERPQAERTRDVSARWAERAGPVVVGEAGRVVTTFGASIPTAFCAPLIVCAIELEPGELLTDTPSIGDSARWQMAIKVQGGKPGDQPETMVIELKPADDAGMTNLVIPTDRRLYTITLINDPDIYTPVLSFRYPDTDARKVAARIAAQKAHRQAADRAAAAQKAAAAQRREAALEKVGVETAAGLRDPATLDFAFRVTGSAPFKPVRVYTDGQKTYVDLHPSYSGPLPTLVPARGEENKVLNTRVGKGGTQLIADRVIRDMWLTAGKRRVRIRRTGR